MAKFSIATEANLNTVVVPFTHHFWTRDGRLQICSTLPIISGQEGSGKQISPCPRAPVYSAPPQPGQHLASCSLVSLFLWVLLGAAGEQPQGLTYKSPWPVAVGTPEHDHQATIGAKGGHGLTEGWPPWCCRHLQSVVMLSGRFLLLWSSESWFHGLFMVVILSPSESPHQGIRYTSSRISAM